MNIADMGMACPVGLRWTTACAAIRAGIKHFGELPYTDNDGQELTGCALARLDAIPSHRARWMQLLAWALGESLESTSIEERARLPVVLALPPMARGQTPDAGELLGGLDELADEKLGLAPSMTAIICAGSSGGFRALQWARDYIAKYGRCLVGAADSLIGARPLAALAAQRRLLTDDNPDGVLPGEAAACVLLDDERAGSLARIRGLGFAEEPALLTNDLPLRADGVLEAARGALAEANWAAHELDLRVSDAAGESYHFKEQALLLPRLLRQPKPELPLSLPADSLGDAGAAAGLCGLVAAIATFGSRFKLGPRTLCFAGNDAGERAAVALEAVS
jgi:3-oxoacyl-[acyl-carrier-protein] synthase-1